MAALQGKVLSGVIMMRDRLVMVQLMPCRDQNWWLLYNIRFCLVIGGILNCVDPDVLKRGVLTGLNDGLLQCFSIKSA